MAPATDLSVATKKNYLTQSTDAACALVDFCPVQFTHVYLRKQSWKNSSAKSEQNTEESSIVTF